MTCPECGGQMWNYEPGQMRCPNDHVFAIEAIEGVQARVVRVDRPTRKERLGDVIVGMIAAGVAFAIVEVLQNLH